MLIALFFTYRDGEAFAAQIDRLGERILPMRWERISRVVPRTISSTVTGMTLIAIGEGLVLGVAYWIAGVPSPVTLGALTGLMALIPGGAPLSFTLVSIYLVASGSPVAGVALFLWGSIELFIVDKTLRPKLVGGPIKLPFLPTFFGLIGGVKTMGLLGLFIGPVLMAILVAIWREWLHEVEVTAEPVVELPVQHAPCRGRAACRNWPGKSHNRVEDVGLTILGVTHDQRHQTVAPAEGRVCASQPASARGLPERVFDGRLKRGGEGIGASATGETYLASIRSDHGLPPLSPDTKLEKAAAQQAGYMARASQMSHRTGWRKDFATRMKQNGVEGAAAENVAHGAMDPEKLFSMWMDSKGHRRNMLDPRFAHYGLASAEDAQGRKYWALVLGGRAAATHPAGHLASFLRFRCSRTVVRSAPVLEKPRHMPRQGELSADLSTPSESTYAG